MAVRPVFIGFWGKKAAPTLDRKIRHDLTVVNLCKACQPNLCKVFVNYLSGQIILEEHAEYLNVSSVMSAINDKGVYHEIVFPIRSVG